MCLSQRDGAYVRLPGAKGVVFKAQDVAYLVQQFRGREERDDLRENEFDMEDPL